MHPAGASVEKRAVRSQYCSVVLRRSTATKEHWVIPGSKRESLRTSGVLVDSAWLLILGNWRDVLINEGSGVNASENAIYSMNYSGVLHPFSDLQERWRKHWRKWCNASQSYVQFYTASTHSSIFKYCSNVTHVRVQQQSFFVSSELI